LEAFMKTEDWGEVTTRNNRFDSVRIKGVNDKEPDEMLSFQKALARETVKAVADIFALKLMLASTGKGEDELEAELGRLRETALYKTVVGVGEARIAQAEHDQQVLDLMVRMRRAA
jgi:hypothetical protein